MSAALRVLIVDGNTRDYNAKKIAHGGSAAAEQFAAVLQGIDASVTCTILRPAYDNAPALPAGVALEDFHGVAWTGSGLSLCDPETPAVARQVELARRLLRGGVPVFGSCWGLQLAAVALGGSVRRNPKGREIGIARRIVCTDAGAAHPMYRHKAKVFDAIAVHADEVACAPIGMRILARNAMSDIQAAQIDEGAGRSMFWGVQYHPEYDFREIASSLRRARAPMIAEGLVRTEDELDTYAGELIALQDERGRTDLAWRHGLDATVLDPAVRHAELRAWLDFISRRS